MSTTLEEKLHDKSARVLLVNTFQSTQLTLIKGLHRTGITQIAVCRSISELKARTHGVDWIIIALSDGTTTQAMAFLKEFFEKEKNRTRVSFIIREKDSYLLPEAFQYGLMSFFEFDRCLDMDRTYEDLVVVMRELHRCTAENKHDAYVAAHYFRRHLTMVRNWSEIIKLDKSMVEAFPNDMKNFRRLAEAYIDSGNVPKAQEILNQLQQTDSEFNTEDSQRLLAKLPSKEVDYVELNRLNLKHIAVIERDETEVKTLRGALKRLGLNEFHIYNSFASAWEALKKGKIFDMVIAEWGSRKSDLSPSQFLQRFRSYDNSMFTPLVVVVSRLNSEDAQLITDLNPMQILLKPLREDQVAMALSFALEQYRRPTERRMLEQKIIQALQEGNKTYAYHLRELYLSQTGISKDRKHYIQAVFDFYHHNYTKAKNHLVKGIEMSAREPNNRGIRINLDKMTLLAQSLMKLDIKQNAASVLEKATRISPQNIRVHISYMDLLRELGQITEAENAFRTAEKIDPESIVVRLAGSRLKMDIPELEFRGAADAEDDLITLLNNQAVTLIQRDQVGHATQLYAAAIGICKAGNLKGILHFNKALAHLRVSEVDAARLELANSALYPGSKVYERGQSILKKLELEIEPDIALRTPYKEDGGMIVPLPSSEWRESNIKPTVCLLGIYRYIPVETSADAAS